MTGCLPLHCAFAFVRRPVAAPLCAFYVLSGLWASNVAAGDAGVLEAATESTPTGAVAARRAGADADTDEAGAGSRIGTGGAIKPGATIRPPTSGPARETPGIPSDAELEAAGAAIGEIVIDNQNIFNLEDPKDDVKLEHTTDVDRTKSLVEVSDMHAFGGFTAVDVNYANSSDGRLRDFTLNRPFYALDTRWAGGLSGRDDIQTDSLWDRGQVIDQFRDQHEFVQLYGGWSNGLHNGWVRRFSSGVTYDERRFQPVSTWTGVTAIPQDQRFLYPWVQFGLVEDRYLKFFNHDQIARTEDFYIGTTASVRVGWADSTLGSSRSALMLQSSVGRGFSNGGISTLLLASDFSGRLEKGALVNGLLDGSVRYYLEQGRNWLFFTTLAASRGWRLDLGNQILLGGDSGLRGYPLRYQDGTARALWTLEQRFFSDWYPFRLFRVGAAVFFDMGRTWGNAPLAAPSLRLLKDAGFGLRFGNARSGLGNIVHVDLAFPFNGDK